MTRLWRNELQEKVSAQTCQAFSAYQMVWLYQLVRSWHTKWCKIDDWIRQEQRKIRYQLIFAVSFPSRWNNGCHSGGEPQEALRLRSCWGRRETRWRAVPPEFGMKIHGFFPWKWFGQRVCWLNFPSLVGRRYPNKCCVLYPKKAFVAIGILNLKLVIGSLLQFPLGTLVP